LPAEHLHITISVNGDTVRAFTLTGLGERYEELLQKLRRTLPAEIELVPRC
jgi:hypothetical protein